MRPSTTSYVDVVVKLDPPPLPSCTACRRPTTRQCRLPLYHRAIDQLHQRESHPMQRYCLVSHRRDLAGRPPTATTTSALPPNVVSTAWDPQCPPAQPPRVTPLITDEIQQSQLQALSLTFHHLSLSLIHDDPSTSAEAAATIMKTIEASPT